MYDNVCRGKTSLLFSPEPEQYWKLIPAVIRKEVKKIEKLGLPFLLMPPG
jgi:hypothetical protein